MADQNPNQNAQSNIDDLVKELSRTQGTPPGPSSAPMSAAPMPPKPAMPVAPAPMPARPMPAPAPASMPPRPVMPSQPSASAPAPVAPSSTAPSYQSNIRTMADDLASLKSGKQPQGTTAPMPKPAPAPAPMPAPMPKPAAPMPARPMPASPAPVAMAKPSMPAPAPMPRPAMPAPIQPVRPAPAAPSAPSSVSQFYVPDNSSGGAPKNNHNFLFMAIGAAVVVFGVLYWLFFIRPTNDDVIVVPTPIVTATPTATPRIPVSTLFTNSAGTIALTPGADPFKTFTAGTKVITVPAGLLGVLNVVDGTASSSKSLLPFDLFDRLLVAYPVDLKPTPINADGVILAYGQQETFTVKGQGVQSATPGLRLAFITRVSPSASATLRTWETTMTDNLAALFGVNKAKNTGPFSDASYQSVMVRYKNFAYPDMAIDYALVPYNGSTYLVMANSREAMFAVISIFNPPGK